MKVAVGSTNQVDADATRQAFTASWPTAQIDVERVGVRSGVAAQPMSDLECIEGARNRAILAREALSSDYGVGVEAGLVHVGGLWFDCGWVVVVDDRYREGLGSTFRLPVPTELVRRIEHGTEPTTVLDEMLGRDESGGGYGGGYVGRVTNGAVTRAGATSDAIVAALARFSLPRLYD